MRIVAWFGLAVELAAVAPSHTALGTCCLELPVERGIVCDEELSGEVPNRLHHSVTGGVEPHPRRAILQDLSPTHGVSCIGVAIGPRSRRASRLASSLHEIEAT